MKKILFLNNEYELKAGGEIFLLDLLHELKNKYEIFCVCKKEGELSVALANDGVNVVFADVSYSTKIKNLLINYRNFHNLVSKTKNIKNISAIYANSGTVNRVAGRVAKFFDAKLVTHLHDFFDAPKNDKYSLRYSDVILTCSKKISEIAKKYNSNVKVIYNGISKERFSPALKTSEKNLKKKFNIENNFLIGIAGTIGHKKGFFDFVDIAKEISDKIKDVKFIVIGGIKPNENYLIKDLKEKIEKFNLKDKFIFTGFLNDIENALSALDVFIFPAHYEAFGRVLIEAFACKIPVISTYCGGPEEIIDNGENGFLFKVGDVKGMAGKAIELYDDENLRKTIAENAYSKFLDKFTTDKMVASIEGEIEKLIGSED